jgi:uncharacterized protein (DUF924 family)
MSAAPICPLTKVLSSSCRAITVSRCIRQSGEHRHTIALELGFAHSRNAAELAEARRPRLGNADMLHYAKKHHDVIARFNRFPHRNAMLGRQPRGEEISAGDVVPW